jgi:MSHA biogenesis protein MshN
MSLLNDMLRDLSQRKPVIDGAEGYDENLLHSSSITKKQSPAWVSLALLFVIIFVGVLSIKYFMHKFSGEVKSTVATAQSKPASMPIKSVAAPSLAAVPAESSVANDSSELLESLPENAQTTELQNHINDLLLQADRAIAMDRLTAPVEDNAYGYYQKILSMSANNADAKEGLDKIASRLLVKAQEQSRLGNSAQADAFMQRARFVSARFVQAHEINLGRVNDQSITQGDIETTVEAKTPNQSVQSVETIKPFVVVEAPNVSVQPNAGWKDEELARYAQELIQKGKQAEALGLLKNFIATEQKPVHSAELLADLYIQQGNTQAADIIVDKTNYLPVDIKTKLKAQIFSVNGDDAQAITLLEKNLNSADVNEGYRSLLASLYHKTANYQQSIISYQRLMNSFGEKPAYWLGLALAYDGMSQHKSALQAYQRLREYPQLQETVKKYVDQRITALSRE